jgi:protease I
MSQIANTRVLIIATNGFAELVEPRQALIDAGAIVDVAAPSLDPIAGVSGTDLSRMTAHSLSPDLTFEDVDPDRYLALFIPGGLGSPDRMRILPKAVSIVKSFVSADKLVASICHGPWMLIEADAVKGRIVTGWESIRKDLINAGAKVWDEQVVRDRNLLTSRMPADIPFFSEALVEAVKQGSRSKGNAAIEATRIDG